MFESSLMAGFMIGFAALLSCCVENKILSALFFSIGLLYIRITKRYLYTGQIQNLKLKQTSLIELIAGLGGNIAGCGLALFIFIGLACGRPELFKVRETAIALKWSYPFYYYPFSGFCCGVLMTIATNKNTPLWISPLCVMAFILAGFHHCVADWFYLSSTDSYLYWLLIAFGNFIGGLIGAVKLKFDKS